MRSVPARSIAAVAGVSCTRERRPWRSVLSQPAATLRASARRADGVLWSSVSSAPIRVSCQTWPAARQDVLAEQGQQHRSRGRRAHAPATKLLVHAPGRYRRVSRIQGTAISQLLPASPAYETDVLASPARQLMVSPSPRPSMTSTQMPPRIRLVPSTAVIVSAPQPAADHRDLRDARGCPDGVVAEAAVDQADVRWARWRRSSRRRRRRTAAQKPAGGSTNITAA